MTTKTDITHQAIDALSVDAALAAMQNSHLAAVKIVATSIGEIAAAARTVASTLQNGGVLHYAAAGSSGLMALADACELPGTFGISQAQVKIHMAGGVPVDGVMPGDTEDNIDDAIQGANAISHMDTVIVASASGTTPYAVAFATAARKQHATVIGISNIAGSELLHIADVPVAIPTGPEVVSGSTRLGAGTAQKVALNMISTQAGVLLGHVHNGLMINLHPDNIKLRQRATGIVAQLANTSLADAKRALEITQFNTKAATLVARGLARDEALDLLKHADGNLRACLSKIGTRAQSTN